MVRGTMWFLARVAFVLPSCPLWFACQRAVGQPLFFPPPSLVLLVVEAAGFPVQNGCCYLLKKLFAPCTQNPCPPQVPNAGPVLLLLLRLLWNCPG